MDTVDTSLSGPAAVRVRIERTAPLDPTSVAHAAADTNTLGADVAVLVCHGMGQQVHFETLELIANALKSDAGVDVTGRLEGVALHQVGETRLPRADLKLTYKNAEVPVHLFEAWWAPIAEGQITLPEVIGFLARTGWDGLQEARRGFVRFVFGDWQSYPYAGRTTFFKLLLTLLVLGSLVALNGVVAIVAASSAMSRTGHTWPGVEVVSAVSWDVIMFGTVFAALAAFMWLARSNAIAIAALGVLILLGAMALIHLLAGPSCLLDWNRWFCIFRSPWVAIALWLPLIAASRWAKAVLVQYLGDVAIYVQSHRVNRFYETRQKIQARALEVARAVYAAGYKRVVVVGHSLGSVIAYDTLNALINDDLLRPATSLDVVEKNDALITFGSPLDKTAFLFRAQARGRPEVRERLAGMVQPLVQDYAYRPPIWVNVYSPADWISGALTFYDRPQQRTPHAKSVWNVPDPKATIPGVAHTAYWNNRVLAQVLQLAVVNRARLPAYLDFPTVRGRQAGS